MRACSLSDGNHTLSVGQGETCLSDHTSRCCDPKNENLMMQGMIVAGGLRDRPSERRMRGGLEKRRRLLIDLGRQLDEKKQRNEGIRGEDWEWADLGGGQLDER